MTMIAGIGVQIVATMGEIEGNGAIDAFVRLASTLSTGLVSDKRSSTTARQVPRYASGQPMALLRRPFFTKQRFVDLMKKRP
ncbi:hypothetical protein [Agrobacterium sp. OT33]|uniref:hypothetical protein n=1 Tax=Agrobacterium sp. OT33 TaxID=2815338 RepID=UPI001A8D115B|nr:hypothetical protein [Agrobacterium sp. OT33]MBO0126597.1 hypothetical protein [Agrobacterium sp. OT33]